MRITTKLCVNFWVITALLSLSACFEQATPNNNSTDSTTDSTPDTTTGLLPNVADWVLTQSGPILLMGTDTMIIQSTPYCRSTIRSDSPDTTTYQVMSDSLRISSFPFENLMPRRLGSQGILGGWFLSKADSGSRWLNDVLFFFTNDSLHLYSQRQQFTQIVESWPAGTSKATMDADSTWRYMYQGKEFTQKISVNIQGGLFVSVSHTATYNGKTCSAIIPNSDLIRDTTACTEYNTIQDEFDSCMGQLVPSVSYPELCTTEGAADAASSLSQACLDWADYIP